MKLVNVLAGAASRYSETEDEKRAWLAERVSKNRDYLLTSGLEKFQQIKALRDAKKANINEAVAMGFTRQAAQALELQGGLAMQIAKLKKIGGSKGGVINKEALQNASELIWSSVPEDSREKIFDYFTNSALPNNANDLQDKFVMAITNAKRDDADFIAAREILASLRAKERPDVTVTIPTTQNYQALEGTFGLQFDARLRRNIATSLKGIEGVDFVIPPDNTNDSPEITGANAQEANIAINRLVKGYNEAYNKNQNPMDWLSGEINRLKEHLFTHSGSTDKWTTWNQSF